MLLDHRADIYMKNLYGETPEVVAEQCEKPDTVKILRTCGDSSCKPIALTVILSSQRTSPRRRATKSSAKNFLRIMLNSKSTRNKWRSMSAKWR